MEEDPRFKRPGWMGQDNRINCNDAYGRALETRRSLWLNGKPERRASTALDAVNRADIHLGLLGMVPMEVIEKHWKADQWKLVLDARREDLEELIGSHSGDGRERMGFGEGDLMEQAEVGSVLWEYWSIKRVLGEE